MSHPTVNPDLIEQVKALEKAIVPLSTTQNGPTDLPADRVTDGARALDILGAMLRLERVTVDDLRVTKAGLIVAKLCKNSDAELAKKAKEVTAWFKSQVIPVTTPVELAKANAAAAKANLAADVKAASTTAVKKESIGSKEDSDSDSNSKKRKKEEKQKEETDSKKRKTASSPATLPPTKSSSAVTSKNATLSQKYPELTEGKCGLFKMEYDDPQRATMQHLLWTSLGEPSAKVVELLAKQTASAAELLKSYHLQEKPEEEKKDITEPSSTVAPSPSPPPIGNIHLSDTPAPSPEPSNPTTSTATTSTTAPSTAPITASSSSGHGRIHTRQELAFHIEEAMFKKFGSSNAPTYKQKYRDLASNLRDPKNPELNESLYLGHISSTDLVNMNISALAPSSLKEKREKEAAYNREAARSDIGNDAGATDQFLCDRCKGRNCTYFQMQTRGADEPMTIFVTCLDCGNKFRSGDGER